MERASPRPPEVRLARRAPSRRSLTNTLAADGYVRIWSIEAILNSHDPSYTKPRQLAALSHHSGTVHTVRFSPNGKYLASGADDKIVCVYTLDPNAPAHVAFGASTRDEQSVGVRLTRTSRFQ